MYATCGICTTLPWSDDGMRSRRYAGPVSDSPSAPVPALSSEGDWMEPAAFVFIALLVAGRLRMEGAHPGTFAIVAVGLAGLLWGRRRHRLAGSLIALGAAIIGLAVESSVDPATGFLAGAAVYLVTVRGERRAARARAAVAVVVFLLALATIGGPTFGEFIRNMAPLLLGFAAGEATWYRRAVLAEAEARAHLAEVTRDEEARARVREERIRIARELHDIVGHSLSIINVQAGVAAHVIKDHPEVAEKALAEIREISHGALQELRSTVGVLRTGSDEGLGLAPTPQLDDIPALVESFRDAGLTVALYLPAERPGLGAGQELAVYRVIQEALTNVVRHAPGSEVQVSLVFPPGEVSVEIANDGEVVEMKNDILGQGLVGMRERMGALGGTVDAHPRPEGGFLVRARFPVHRS